MRRTGPVSADPGLDTAVARMLAGDDEGFAAVYRNAQPPLLRYLTVLVGAGDAEDVAAETWAQAIRDLQRFTGDADGFRGWLTTIGRHRALDHLRAQGRRPVVDSGLPLDRAGTADTEQAALETISTAAALALVASLPPDQAEAVLLRTMLGLDALTAARLLGKRPGAVRTAAHRGLRTLAARLEPPMAVPRPRTRCDVPAAAGAEGMT